MVKKTKNNKPLAKNTGLIPEVTGPYKTFYTSIHDTEKRIVLFIAILSGFITPFDGSAVNVALPSMGKEFHTDAIALSWIATAYLLTAAIFLVPFG